VPDTTNISPAFAREASQLLHEGYIQRATELCIAGTARFPTYATGFLILGKCYDIVGSAAESLAAYRRAHALLPDHPTLQDLVRQAEAKAQRAPAKIIEHEPVEATRIAPTPAQAPAREHDAQAHVAQPRENVLPAVEPVPPLPSPPQESVQQTESTLDYLTRRLQNVKRIKPNPALQVETVRVETEHGVKFVTPTMAEIFVTQGEYREAINAYKELIKQHPSEEHYKRRVAEIEQLLVVQEREKS
jgi:tetratricopeptide (TPR) repeat protein